MQPSIFSTKEFAKYKQCLSENDNPVSRFLEIAEQISETMKSLMQDAKDKKIDKVATKAHVKEMHKDLKAVKISKSHFKKALETCPDEFFAMQQKTYEMTLQSLALLEKITSKL